MSKPGPRRLRTIIPPAWWVREAEQRRKRAGITQESMVERAKRLLIAIANERPESPMAALVRQAAKDLDQSRLSRCLTGESSPIEIIEVISTILSMPPPIVIARTIGEARELQEIHSSYALLADEADRELTELIEDGEASGSGVKVLQADDQPQVVRGVHGPGKGTRPHRGSRNKGSTPS